MQVRHIGIVGSIFFLASQGWAECGHKTAFYFANGMFNDKTAAADSLKTFKKVAIGVYPERTKKIVKWEVAYNTNESVLVQLWQVFDQKRAEVTGNFWSTLIILVNKSREAQSKVFEILKGASEKQLKKDADLRLQVRNYESDLKNGLNVITVAHSQGNFYSLFAFDDLLPQFPDRLNLISVATPASRAHKDRYTTLMSDGIIVPIPDSLPPNAKKPNPGPFDHQFIEAYLGPGEAKSFILENFKEAIDESASASTGPLDEWPIINQPDFDSSLDPALAWIRPRVKNPNAFEPHQCLVIFVLMDLQAVKNISCEERDLKSAEEAVDDCALDIKRVHRARTACPFGGIGNRNSIAPAIQEMEFRDLNPKCNWIGYGDMARGLDYQGALKAKEFLRTINK